MGFRYACSLRKSQQQPHDCTVPPPADSKALATIRATQTEQNNHNYLTTFTSAMCILAILFNSRNHLVCQLAALWLNNNSTASMERCSLFCPLIVRYALFCYLQSFLFCFWLGFTCIFYLYLSYFLYLYLTGVADVTAFIPALFDRLLLLLSLHKCLYVSSCPRLSVSVDSAIALRSISTL